MKQWGVAAQYIALALVWGSSFLFMKVASDGVSAPQMAFARLLLGAIVLIVIMAITRRRWPRGRAVWTHLLVVSLTLCVIPFLLFAWASQHIPSGLSSIYNATTPIMTMLISLALLPGERLSGARVAGIFLAAIGVVVLAAPWTIPADAWGGSQTLAQLACLGATASYGFAYAYMRRYVQASGLDAPTIAAGQVTLGAIIMALLMPAIGRDPITLTTPIVLSLIALGALGTGIAYIWNTRVIQAWGATIASTVTYIAPVVGVTLGILVLGEQLHWNEPVGAALVVLGILASQGRLRIRRSRVESKVTDRTEAPHAQLAD